MFYLIKVLKRYKKQLPGIRYKEKQFNPNAAKNYYNIIRQIRKKMQTILSLNEVILNRAKSDDDTNDNVSELLVKSEEPKVTFIESAEFNHVSEDSVKSIQEIERKIHIAENNKPIFDVNPTSKKRRTQKEIDQELVDAFYKNPSSRSFYTLWKRYYIGIKAYAYKIMGDNSRADDMVQLTFQRAWEHRHMYNPKTSVYATWLYAICRNFCIDTLRHDSKSQIVDIDVSDMFDSVVYKDSIKNSHHTDEKYYVVNDNTHKLEAGTYDDIVKKMFDTSFGEMDNFDPVFRDIIILKDMEGLSIIDIAKRLGITESRVKNLYYKNKASLAERIKKKHSELFIEYQSALAERTDNSNPTIFKFTPIDDETETRTDSFVDAN